MKIVVNVSLKNGVLDSQGKAVQHALNSIGFNNVDNVRVGKQIIFDLNESDETKARDDVTKMCEDLLANTVIEDYSIETVK